MRKIVDFFRTLSLSFLLLFNIFIIITITLGLVVISFYFGLKFSVISLDILYYPPTGLIIIFSVSIILTISLVTMLYLLFTKNLKLMISSMQKVAQGDYQQQLKISGIFVSNEIKQYEYAFNRTVDKLSKTEILQLDFINNFSHELKTPITAISGFGSLLTADEISDAERIEYANIIVEEATRLSNLSTSILTLSKLDNIVALNTQLINCETIVKQVLRTLDQQSISNHQFITNLEQFTLECDKDLIAQLLINLIANSVKFSPENSQIIITTMSQNNTCQITIEDFGIGMDENSIEHIFSKFYQENSASYNGYGIGLAVVKRIVDLHHGQCQVESKLHHGTTFTITLPLIQTEKGTK